MVKKKFHHGMKYTRSLHLHFALAVLMTALAACAPAPGGAAATPAAATTPAPSATALSGAGVCENPLYPVVLGASWNYHASGGPTGDFDFSSSITAVNEDNFVEESLFSGLTKSVIWQCNPTGLALLSPGGGVSASINTSGSAFEFTTTGSTGDTLPKVIAAGDAWTQTLTLHGENELADGMVATSDGSLAISFTAAGMEDVTVPAGTFSAMRIDVETTFIIETTIAGTTVPVELHMTGSVWYAPGIGMVKNTSSGEGIDTIIVLTAYSVP
jgi:hypothetical protein